MQRESSRLNCHIMLTFPQQSPTWHILEDKNSVAGDWRNAELIRHCETRWRRIASPASISTAAVHLNRLVCSSEPTCDAPTSRCWLHPAGLDLTQFDFHLLSASPAALGVHAPPGRQSAVIGTFSSSCCDALLPELSLLCTAIAAASCVLT